MKITKDEIYIPVEFPDIQLFMHNERWEECELSSYCEIGIPSSYFVPLDLYEEVMGTTVEIV